jgi:hypothetical protein
MRIRGELFLLCALLAVFLVVFVPLFGWFGVAYVGVFAGYMAGATVVFPFRGTEIEQGRRRLMLCLLLGGIAWSLVVLPLAAAEVIPLALGFAGTVGCSAILLLMSVPALLRSAPPDDHPDGTRAVPRLTKGELAYAVFSFLAWLGFPATLIGAITDRSALVVAGFVLLALFVLDRAVVYPVMKARAIGGRHPRA